MRHVSMVEYAQMETILSSVNVHPQRLLEQPARFGAKTIALVVTVALVQTLPPLQRLCVMVFRTSWQVTFKLPIIILRQSPSLQVLPQAHTMERQFHSPPALEVDNQKLYRRITPAQN
jgi:hypothetical protein